MINSRYASVLLFSLLFIAGFSMSFVQLKTKPIFFSNNHFLTFDCPTLDDSKMIINAAACGVSNGSIIGLQGTGTGTLSFTWYDTHNVVVSTTADLIGVPTGTYHVTLKDSSKCPAITAFYNIGENNPITIDNSNIIIIQPGCNANNGSITTINVTAATKYLWTDVNNIVVGNAKDLTGVAAGAYVLTASNATGCMTQSRYIIGAGITAPVMTAYTIAPSDCANSGEFHATFDLKPADPLYVYTITDTTGQPFFSGALAYQPGDSTRINIPAHPFPLKPPPDPGLPAGTYTLTTLGGGNCFTKLLTFTIPYSKIRIDTSNVLIVPDVCGLNTGGISGLTTAGANPPFSKNTTLHLGMVIPGGTAAAIYYRFVHRQ